MDLGLGISGTAAPQTSVRASTGNAGPRAVPQKRNSNGAPTASGSETGEVAVGSGLNDKGFSDLDLENICRLQYAKWHDVDEYISLTGSAPDLWPNGLIKSTKKKGDDCKFYWKKVPEWKHMWGKASMS